MHALFSFMSLFDCSFDFFHIMTHLFGQICLNFQKGRCPHGENCRRQHVEAEGGNTEEGSGGGKSRRRRPRKPRAPRDPDADVSEQVCRNYLAGRCRFGDSCRRIHEGDVEQEPVEKLDEVCNNFLAGKCHFGDNCRRIHEE